MENSESAVSKERVGSVGAVWRRRIPAVLLPILTITLAISTAFFSVRSEPLKWIVSPPIDAEGRKIHVLVPVGLQPEISWRTSYGEIRTVIIRSPQNFDAMKSDNIIRSWLMKLKVLPVPKQSEATVALSLGQCVGGPNFLSYMNPKRFIAGNRVLVPSTNLQAGVSYYDTRDNPNVDAVATAVCRSIYVK